jgi:hypothetical protein
MIQTMMINEIKKHIDGEESDEEYEETTMSKVILAPIQMIYESGSDEDY